MSSTLQLVTAATILAIVLGITSASSRRSVSTARSTTASRSRASSSTRCPSFLMGVMLKVFIALGFNNWLRDPASPGRGSSRLALISREYSGKPSSAAPGSVASSSSSASVLVTGRHAVRHVRDGVVPRPVTRPDHRPAPDRRVRSGDGAAHRGRQGALRVAHGRSDRHRPHRRVLPAAAVPALVRRHGAWSSSSASRVRSAASPASSWASSTRDPRFASASSPASSAWA